MLQKAYHDRAMLAIVAVSLIIVLASLVDAQCTRYTERHAVGDSTITVTTVVPWSSYKSQYVYARVDSVSIVHESLGTVLARAEARINNKEGK